MRYGEAELHHGDCIEIMRTLPSASVDAIVTDPPYALSFLGKGWDSFRSAREFQKWCNLWALESRRLLKPGGHILAFGGTRTWHRLGVAIEDAGFEIRDSIAWLHSEGTPKGIDISKAIDKEAGAEREVLGPNRWADRGNPQAAGATVLSDMTRTPVTAPATPDAARWAGWNTALKSAHEPIVVGRKPLARATVAANVLEHGVGGLNIDATRIGEEERLSYPAGSYLSGGRGSTEMKVVTGRWPANAMLDEGQAKALGDSARFFYVAKARKNERPSAEGVHHPTVKPLALMRELVRLATPPGGVLLDPFAGSGTTLEAALLEGMRPIGIEQAAEYIPLIRERLERATV